MPCATADTVGASPCRLRFHPLGPGKAVPFAVTVKLADLTTRKHYPGGHAIDLLVNGKPFPLGTFALTLS